MQDRWKIRTLLKTQEKVWGKAKKYISHYQQYKKKGFKVSRYVPPTFSGYHLIISLSFILTICSTINFRSYGNEVEFFKRNCHMQFEHYTVGHLLKHRLNDYQKINGNYQAIIHFKPISQAQIENAQLDYGHKKKTSYPTFNLFLKAVNYKSKEKS